MFFISNRSSEITTAFRFQCFLYPSWMLTKNTFELCATGIENHFKFLVQYPNYQSDSLSIGERGKRAPERVGIVLHNVEKAAKHALLQKPTALCFFKLIIN